MNAFGLAPLLYVLPIVGVLFNTFAGIRLASADPKRGEAIAGWFATTMTLLCFGIAVLQVLSLQSNDYHAQTIPLLSWIHIPSAGLEINWAMYIDTLSATMLLVITGVGSLIHIYAIGYMHGDKDFAKFFVYLNLFVFFMLILVTGNSYLTLFVGWEGVGLCSFLLIGFWFDKPHGVGLANNRAARKAFIVNRLGDFAMILAMTLTFWVFHSLDYETVFGHALEMYESKELVPLFGSSYELGTVLSWITVLFLLGATGKSAQIPFYVWLPDAMAGPTPVSALIHAATMVTSGIYLITRSNVLFEIVRDSHVLLFGLVSTNDIVAFVGAFTALSAGLIAFTQYDVKKVLAYSTVSQLGFMIAAVGMGAYVAGMFHLVTHAFFKALLFMGSGSIIHGMEHGHHHLHDHHGHGGGHGHDDKKHDAHGHDAHGHDDHHHDDHHADEDHHDDFDPQDMRTMGGLRHKMPWTFWTYMIGTLALAGIFPFAGFWSKDEILAHAATAEYPIFLVVRVLLTLAAICTAFYMGRQIKMVFFGTARHEAAEHASESSWQMVFPLVVLAILSTAGGFLNTPYFSEAAAEAAGVGHATTAEHTTDASHEEATDDHATDESHSEETAAEEGHGEEATDDHSAEEAHDTGYYLVYEHWLEHSIQSFELTDEKVLHMPHTPVVLQLYTVAIPSTVLAILSMGLAVFVVFGSRPLKASDPDPLQVMPGIGSLWKFWSTLPLNTLYINIFVERIFNPFSDWLAFKVDWEFWHDFFHNNIIRDTFNTIADFMAEILDPKGVDGFVLGVAHGARRLADVLRVGQTGNVGNYALTLFLGVVVLVAYFVMMSGS